MTQRSTGRRRRWAGRTGVITGAAVLAAGAAVAAAIGFGGARPTPTATNLTPATATVTRQTVVDTADIPGKLAYGATTTLPGRIQGVITKMPLAGDVIGRGQPIYRVDNTPVVLMYGEVAAYRTLGPGVTGPDVRQLGDNLTALGYAGLSGGNTYTAATARAVKQWQKSLGLPQTGAVELGRVLFAPTEIRVDSVAVGVNESTGDGQAVLHYTGTSRVVTVQLQVSQQRLAREGTQVQIQLPDGRTVAGVVQRVSTVIEAPADPRTAAVTLIEALVSLADASAAAGIEAAVVTVIFTGGEHKDVLTVPVAALVALAEGGYGLEVVEGSTTHYIKVSTGLFAHGRVEVTGDGLTEGMTVGMPRD